MGGLEVVGWVDREGGQPEAGHAFHQDTDNSGVSAISDKNRYSQQNRLKQ